MGGYLSRVNSSAKRFYRRLPVMSALMDISEGRTLDPRQAARAAASASDFLRRANLGYVVVETRYASQDLRSFAVDLFELRKVAEADDFELYVPGRDTR